MANQFDSGDDIGSISRKLESISTHANQSSLERSKTNQTFFNVLNPTNKNATDSGSIESDNFVFGNNLPPINCSEKIIFLIDNTVEPDCTVYELGVGKKYSPLQIIKKALEVFVLAKGGLKGNHEFMIMTLGNNSVDKVCDFTNNTKQLTNHLEKITEVPIPPTDCFDLSLLFEAIHPYVSLDVPTPIPTSVTRVILIYTRSYCVPIISGFKQFEKLMEHPYFFVDLIYVHEPLGENNSEKIYGELQRLDKKDNSYMLEVGRNAAQLYNTVVKLVAHPLQRAKQDDANYNIFLSDTSSDV